MEHVQHVQEMGKKHWLFDMQRKRNVKAERKKLLVSLKSVLLSCPHLNTGYKRTFHYISRIDGHFGIFFSFSIFYEFYQSKTEITNSSLEKCLFLYSFKTSPLNFCYTFSIFIQLFFMLLISVYIFSVFLWFSMNGIWGASLLDVNLFSISESRWKYGILSINSNNFEWFRIKSQTGCQR